MATGLRAARLSVLQERAWLIVLPVVTAALTALLCPSYGDTFRTPQDLAVAVASAQGSQTSRLLYGSLPESAGLVQFAAWELGALTCLVLGIVMSLRAAARSRGDEDLGRAELLHAAGAGPGMRLAGQAVALGLECLLVGAGTGVGLLALDGTGGTDAAAYGGAVAGTCLALTCLTLLVAQLVQDAAGARGLALLIMGLAFIGCGLDAAEDWHWAGWASPFRLRAAMDPGGDNDWTPCLWAASACAVLLAMAVAVAGRRDLGLGALRLARPWAGRRLRVAGPVGLALELAAGQFLAWAATSAVITGLLVSMGEGVVDLAREGGYSGHGHLGSLRDGADAGRAFLAYIGALTGALASSQAVSLVRRYGGDEQAGRLESARSTGTRPSRLLMAWWIAACLGAGACLAAGSLAAGAVGGSALGTDAGDALRLVGGQWPAAAAAAGLGAALCGWAQQWRGLAWLPVLMGLGITQLGGVMGLPQEVRDAAPFAQAGERGCLWLVAIAVVGLAVGALGAERRDIASSSQRRRFGGRSAPR
ncbi:hypothetical protein [Actinomyces bowdenii]|uniref:ABC transporter permease n=1 Tax=Actinomyces bowdenii TaxID=131109 RepID=A0A3P1V7C6_9ACTO|nr:hypothetical protein [Actinomyces bowdenii]RRD29245.1 hypothetical protein EII10_06955 [Actinomyces bowdenii]